MASSMASIALLSSYQNIDVMKLEKLMQNDKNIWNY